MNGEEPNIFNGLNTQMINTAIETMRNNTEMAKVTFSVRSEWNGGFSVMSTSKDFRLGGQNVVRNTEYKMQYDFPVQLLGDGKGPTVCEGCMGALAACLTQTMVAHGTSKGIQLESIKIDVEGDVDMRGFSGKSNDVRRGAHQFRVKINIKSRSASKEQLYELPEIGKKFSPAFDTLTNGTNVIVV